MRSIDHVIEKYYSLKVFKSRKTTNVKRLRPTIYALRSVTEAFLCKYHHNEKFTLFYSLINAIKSRCRKQNIQTTKKIGIAKSANTSNNLSNAFESAANQKKVCEKSGKKSSMNASTRNAYRVKSQNKSI